MQRRLASSFAQEEFASLINYNQALRVSDHVLLMICSTYYYIADPKADWLKVMY